jgi:hypothetical protein
LGRLSHGSEPPAKDGEAPMLLCLNHQRPPRANRRRIGSTLRSRTARTCSNQVSWAGGAMINAIPYAYGIGTVSIYRDREKHREKSKKRKLKGSFRFASAAAVAPLLFSHFR